MFKTSSSALFYRSNDRIYIAWYLDVANSDTAYALPGDGTAYDGHFRFAEIPVVNSNGAPTDLQFWYDNDEGKTVGYFHEQVDYFGHATAVAYHHWVTEDGDIWERDFNLFIGGAVDISRKDNTGEME